KWPLAALPPANTINRRLVVTSIRDSLISYVPYASTAIIDWLRSHRTGLLVRRLARTIESVRPDIVHGLTIPFEGIAAAAACRTTQLVLCVWGNVFALHSASSGSTRRLTARALVRADGLIADCRRDVKLAATYGFDPSKPDLVVPGSGGVDSTIFFPARRFESNEAPLIINTRGIRPYVRTDNFIRAIPLVLRCAPTARFAAVGIAGHAIYERLVGALGIGESIQVLPKMSQTDIGSLCQRARVFVSPSEHDGTPNTLLEAMACGVFPIVGRLESLREWITDSVNGIFCDPS